MGWATTPFLVVPKGHFTLSLARQLLIFSRRRHHFAPWRISCIEGSVIPQASIQSAISYLAHCLFKIPHYSDYMEYYYCFVLITFKCIVRYVRSDMTYTSVCVHYANVCLNYTVNHFVVHLYTSQCLQTPRVFELSKNDRSLVIGHHICF